MDNDDYRILNNLGKLSAILDIYHVMMISYRDEEKEAALIEDCIESTQNLMQKLVDAYNEKQSKS